MNYEQTLEFLINALKGLCDDAISPSLPFKQRNVGQQKLQTQHLQFHIDGIEPVGKADNFDYGMSARNYEVYVDLACHRNHMTTMAGGSEVQLQKILHALDGHTGTYLKHFTSKLVSFLRVGTILRRDYPVDKNQWEERSTVRLVFGITVILEDTVDVGWIETIKVTPLRVYDTPTHVAVEDTIEVTYNGSYIMAGYVENGYVDR